VARARLAAAAIVALAIAVHAPSLGGSFLLDDGVQIYKNRAVTAGAPLGAWFLDRGTTSSRADYNTRIYRPLRNLAFRAVVLVGGVRPLAFKLVNLLLYALSALLVLALLRRLVADERAAAWATAVWVVLPVHVEPVVYASALGDQLSLALELGALVTAIDFVRDGGRGRALASTALAAAAMLAKEMAVTEPALVVLVAVALERGRARRSPTSRCARTSSAPSGRIRSRRARSPPGCATHRGCSRTTPGSAWRRSATPPPTACRRRARSRSSPRWSRSRSSSPSPGARDAWPPSGSPCSRWRWCRCCTSCRYGPIWPTASRSSRRWAWRSRSPPR
jgi:hypothetical protein